MLKEPRWYCGVCISVCVCDSEVVLYVHGFVVAWLWY